MRRLLALTAALLLSLASSAAGAPGISVFVGISAFQNQTISAVPATGAGDSPPATPTGGLPCSTTTSTAATTRSAVSTNVGGTVCYTGTFASLDLSSLAPASQTTVRAVSGATVTGQVNLSNASRITWGGRAESVEMVATDHVTIDQATLGGTSSSRPVVTTLDLNGANTNTVIQDSDIGWTEDDNNNAGYGIRFTGVGFDGSAHDILIQRNNIHNVGADAIQVGGGPVRLTIDRNVFQYVCAHSGSGEHSDATQMVNWGTGFVYTNNYAHHVGFRDSSMSLATANSDYPAGGTLYLHGDNPDARVENNLGLNNRNFVDVTGLGTGGTQADGYIFRRNTYDLGGLGTNLGGLEVRWRVTSGSGNVSERNAIHDYTIDDAGSHTTQSNNVTGSNVVLDANGDCTSAACNPAAQEAIGFRKPTGVPY